MDQIDNINRTRPRWGHILNVSQCDDGYMQ